MGNPKSFKIHRNSPLAATLKSSISRKLLEFLGNYTDDVLAEYITVLICNGKHQNQARDDLEAFLGDQSEEFVSWLWDLLLEHADQSNASAVPLDSKEVNFSIPHDHDATMEYNANKSKKFDNHDTGNADGSLTKGFDAPSNDANTKKVFFPTSKNEMASKVVPVEDIYDNSLAYGSSGNDGSSVMPAGGVPIILYMDKHQKTVNNKGIDLPNKHFLPPKQLLPRRLQSSIADNPLPRQASTANVYGRSLSPRAVTPVSNQSQKSRGSVWDRLGKPHDNTLERSKTVDAFGVSIREQNGEVLDQGVPVLPMTNGNRNTSVKGEAPGLGSADNNSGKCRELEWVASSTGDLNVASNIGRKRHFGESSTLPGSSSVSLAGERNTDIQFKETSRDSKKSKPIVEVSEATTPAQKMLDLKLRFHQLEMEMHKLRSKHTDVKKSAKNSGTSKHPEEDVESRTVYVTNVHFAANKEALSNHFAKCGLVVDVVIWTDETIAQRNRFALVTFASRESVNKALALSGTSFFSRTMKVLRKAEAATETPTQVRSPRINKKAILDRPLNSSPHLQWRRDALPKPSQPLASANIQLKLAPVSDSEQQLPS